MTQICSYDRDVTVEFKNAFAFNGRLNTLPDANVLVHALRHCVYFHHGHVVHKHAL